ncbi:MAG: dihydroorotate dehydrogenase electron transfer subunit [Candidatus Omnitrophica bacterium]|nr:dihydroorotate dehydrogenase electron transfer subunit [Candidatus Omnitrophota bacterium]
MRLVKAKIVSNKKVAAGRFKIRLAAPSISKAAEPGQFVMVKCSDGLDPLLRRPFSFHRIERGFFELLYQVIGRGTAALSERKKGERLDVIGPLGNGFDALSAKRYPLNAILVAGGIGVAPLLALAERLAHSVERIAFSIFIGARNKEHLLCEKDFKKLGARLYVAAEDGSKGYKGLVTDLLKKELYAKRSTLNAKVYACGPRDMLKAVADIARLKHFPCEVSLEEKMACGIGACLGCAVKTLIGHKMVCKDGPVFNAGDIIW